jgi:hypothetical protein
MKAKRGEEDGMSVKEREDDGGWSVEGKCGSSCERVEGDKCVEGS